MASLQTDYLVIGNCAAGVSAAESIRGNAPDSATITIISNEPYPAYGRPLISYLIEGKTTEDFMWLKGPSFYDDLHIDTLFGSDYKAIKLDPEAHQVELQNGDKITYGKCLLATGSVPFIPPIEGLREGSNVHGFMTLDDAKGLWRAAEAAGKVAAEADRPSRIVVIGSGLIGLKAAEAISRFVDEVLVLELAPRILPAVLDVEGAQILQDSLAAHGIHCLPGVSAEKLNLEDDVVKSMKLTNGDEVECDLVVAAVGVRPNSSLAVEAGAEEGRGLVCDSNLMTSLPDVYAAGDVVQAKDALDGSLHPLALWPHAVQQGKAAGKFMAGAQDAGQYEGGFAVNAVDFFDDSLLTSGIINPPDDGGYEVKVIAGEGSYAKFVTKDDRLMGYILLNRPENAGIYTSLIENATDLSTVRESIFDNAPCNIDLSEDHCWDRLHKGYPSDRSRLGWKEVVHG